MNSYVVSIRGDFRRQRFGRPRSRVCIGLDGAVQGTLNFRALPFDVEAVAVHDNRLCIADIGDSDRRRSFVRIFSLKYPRANGLTVSYHAYDFRYLDGPHNAETLLVK